MSHFEEHLWDTVVDRYGVHLAETGPVAASSQRRPRLLIGAAGGLAASATAVSLLVGATASAPAFAVTRQKDGAVLVKVNRPSGVAPANRKLAAMGVKERVAVVVPQQSVPPACMAARHAAATGGGDGKQVIIFGTPGQVVSTTFTVSGHGPLAHATSGTGASGNTGGVSGVSASGNTGGTTVAGNTGGVSGVSASGNTGGTTVAGNTGGSAPASGTTWYVVACPVGTTAARAREVAMGHAPTDRLTAPREPIRVGGR